MEATTRHQSYSHCIKFKIQAIMEKNISIMVLLIIIGGIIWQTKWDTYVLWNVVTNYSYCTNYEGCSIKTENKFEKNLILRREGGSDVYSLTWGLQIREFDACAVPYTVALCIFCEHFIHTCQLNALTSCSAFAQSFRASCSKQFSIYNHAFEVFTISATSFT